MQLTPVVSLLVTCLLVSTAPAAAGAGTEPSPDTAPTRQPAGQPAGLPVAASVDGIELVVRPPTGGPGRQSPSATEAGGTTAPAEPGADAPQRVVADRAAGEGRVTTPVVETDTFALLGLTWPADVDGAALEPRVRTRDGGRWSGWRTLEPGTLPDPGTSDAAAAVRGGTEPVWVGRADAVQVSVSTTAAAGAPERVTLALVDPGEEPTTAVATAASSAVAPRIVTRAEWGAPATNPCALDEAATLVGAVAHHTASTNAYATPAEARAAIRAFYTFHTQGRGWCDIGYNFLVDRWGNVYEGRAGSVERPVIGVHTGGFNTGTVGVAMIGDFSSVAPPPAMLDAVGRVMGWRLARHGVDPAGSIVYRTPGGENSRFPAGTDVHLPVVWAHRDTAFTTCPGDRGYAAMSTVRARAAAVAAAEPLVRSSYADMLGRAPDPVGLVGWSGALSDGMGAVALADALAVSREYAERRVTEAYRRLLGRAPDPGGLRDWTAGVMAGALRPEDLPGALIASEEYYRRSGGTDARYVARLYEDVLGRAAAPGEVSTWTGVIPSVGRGVVSRGVWRSLESAARQVEGAYATFLDRGPDPVGLAAWAPVLQAHGERSLRAGLVGSGEYRARAFRVHG